MRTWVSLGNLLVAAWAVPVFASGCVQKTFNECTGSRSCSDDAGADGSDEEAIVVQPVAAGNGGGADAGPDAAPEAGGCSATQLLCDGECVPDDPRNCGACGHDCTSLPNVAGSVTCSGGACVFDASACTPGFAHCAGSPDLGCETNLATQSNCGACGNACATSVAHAQATCSGGACGYQCTAAYPDACGGRCVDFSADTGNCGACGNACTGGATCQGGGCGCPGGTHDCSGTCASDSSTASCGTTSCTPCPAPANGTATCNGSSCGISCNAGFSPCGDACVDETQNGNCGGCGITCAISCTSSRCIQATGISAGYSHTCAVLSDGTVECWGDNTYGQLGYATTQMCGSAPCSPSPKVVPGLAGVAAVAAGGSHTCALLTDGKVQCWGLDAYGETGVAPCDGGPCSTAPSAVSGLPPAVAVAAGLESSCAVISGGMVECWGNASVGLLGDMSITGQSSTPVQVSGLTAATAAALGELHACALQSDRTVVCWGDDGDDELGSAPAICDTSNDQCSAVPVPVTGLSSVTALASGGGLATCALVGGGAECWGYLQTGLGDQAATVESFTPVSVANVVSATGLAVGEAGACVLLSGGTAACWGRGPLGNGTTSASSIPVPVSNLTGATALAVGQTHACALLSTGAVSCWSNNSSGQLGNGTTNASLTPTPVLW